MIIEVFKTNVKDAQATMVVQLIHHLFEDHHANFDLQDCDRILRVQANGCCINTQQIIQVLRTLDIDAEVLKDEIEIPTQRASGYHF